MLLNLLTLVSAVKSFVVSEFKAAKSILITGIADAGFIAVGSGQTAKRDGLQVSVDGKIMSILPGAFLCSMYRAGKPEIEVSDTLSAADCAKVVSIIVSAKSTSPVKAAFAAFVKQGETVPAVTSKPKK